MNDNIQGPINIGRVFLKRNETDVTVDLEIKGKSAQLLDGELRATGLINWPANDKESDSGSRTSLQDVPGRSQEYLMTFPSSISGHQSDANRRRAYGS